MSPVTTGRGISDIFTDDLATLAFDLRTWSRNERWRLYIEALNWQKYSFRVYSPDLHTEIHTVPNNPRILETIRRILVKEENSWQSRVLLSASSGLQTSS
jgi:hypothetical protein